MKNIFKEYKKLKFENKILKEENYNLKKENIIIKRKNKIIKKIESRLNYELKLKLCDLTKETIDLLKIYINM